MIQYKQRQIATVFLFSICVVAPLIRATDVKYCNKKDYDVKVKEVEISPNPVARGQPAIFSISLTTDEAIPGGKVLIDVAYFGWNVYRESHDLCTQTSCPVTHGDFLLSHSQILPVYTPPGSYSLTMKMYDGNNRELTCISFDFSIGFGSPIADG